MLSNWKNSQQHFGWVSIVLHWSMAILLIAMYFIGDYMVELDYYDTWYHKAPALHKAAGVLLIMLLIFRFVWNYVQAKPQSLQPEKTLQNQLARLGHLGLYGLVLILGISGYLISTAKGQGIDVFGLFSVPAILPDNADRGELAGDIHEVAAKLFLILVIIHAAAASVHHFIYKDRTLLRMLGFHSSMNEKTRL